MSEEKKQKSMIELLSEPLSKDDIEFRIGQASDGKGFSLLAYKTARVDAKRLNEVFGLKWSNEYFYDATGNLVCKISVYDPNISQWISRADIGTESKTEAEKGAYSDAFKRAAFKWGIGAELYDFPFMWVQWDEWKSSGGKNYPVFQARDIEIAEYEFANGSVKRLKLVYKNKVIYEFGKQQPTQNEKQQEPAHKTPSKLTADEWQKCKNEFISKCEDRLKDTGETWGTFLNWSLSGRDNSDSAKKTAIIQFLNDPASLNEVLANFKEFIKG